MRISFYLFLIDYLREKYCVIIELYRYIYIHIYIYLFNWLIDWYISYIVAWTMFFFLFSMTTRPLHINQIFYLLKNCTNVYVVRKKISLNTTCIAFKIIIEIILNIYNKQYFYYFKWCGFFLISDHFYKWEIRRIYCVWCVLQSHQTKYHWFYWSKYSCQENVRTQDHPRKPTGYPSYI